jgi:hypothetical protein
MGTLMAGFIDTKCIKQKTGRKSHKESKLLALQMSALDNEGRVKVKVVENKGGCGCSWRLIRFGLQPRAWG